MSVQESDPWKENELSPTQSPQKSTISSATTSSSASASTTSTPKRTKSGASAPPANGELRPLRLARQRDRLSSTSSISTSPSGATASFSPDKRRSSANTTSTEDGFQCRPLRIGSNKNLSTEEVKKSEVEQPIGRKKSIQIRNLPIKRNSEASTHSVLSVKSGHNSDHAVDQEDDMIFAMCVVDFHHQRGPEIQWWRSNYHPNYTPDLFRNIPFQALPDGSHLFEETFSNFNLVYDFCQGKSIDDFDSLNEYQGDPRHLKTLFGCSCVRQVRTSELSAEERERNKDITRSMVQKAVVVIVRKQPIFPKIKEKLSIITKSYFLQESLQNTEVLDHLFDNLNSQYKLVDNELHVDLEQEEEYYVNLDLRSSILKFKSKFMIIFKALLLEKKILIYSTDNLENLTQFQNNLISLIPNLINNLDDSGCPLIDYVETNGPLQKPQSLISNNRASMLRFFGLPLQIFTTKNSFWNPYVPLQQLSELKVKSFMIGCSNLLFVNQATSYGVDVLINLDTNEVTYPKTLSQPDYLTLTNPDKKFINHITSTIHPDSKDYIGNDDYIRYQFEDYINSLISVIRYHQYAKRFFQPPPGFAADDANEGSIDDFSKSYIREWEKTENFQIWNAMADEFVFNFIEPVHIGHSLKQQGGGSINRNIANFFTTLKLKSQTSDGAVATAPVTGESKAHKFIVDDDTGATKAEIEDELVAGFEKVGVSHGGDANNEQRLETKAETEANTNRDSKSNSNWSSGWFKGW
ncbi:hypothetical protein KGF57_003416 [Candida theae]|uniref:UDENN domain-containing protein n=1 Tax=Candida theae TaxID=1198502 RepID=A0AAD5FXX6_9ASCO|nr:uncharacterized protein KGF57_003416 [Candida theae]KAI5956696.1 hypothetical protein KGF57_003416 [Candida theae]